MKKSLTCLMLQEMSSGSWYTNKYLAQNFGWRFGGRLHCLKKYGVKFEKEKGQGYIELWRIVSIPKNLKYKDRTRLQLIKLSLLDRLYNLIK